MIFVGDIAVPHGIVPVITEFPDSYRRKIVIANLEGAIVSSDMVSLSDMKLYNNDIVLDFLNDCNIKAVTLANNHIADVPQAFRRTKELLCTNGIAYCGAGNCLSEAQMPLVLCDNGTQYALLSFGWDVISCKYAGRDTYGVNPLTSQNVLYCIAKTKKEYPYARIIIIPHWDYELELYPMPMHRQLAMSAIDAGAFAVIGHHPHCVQGIEIYNNHLIAYSLGNWFIPDGVYMNGRLVFPEYAKDELAVELDNDNIILHHFRYLPHERKLRYKGSSCIANSPEIQVISSFAGMDNKQYEKWFRINRCKNKLLPVFHQDDMSFDSRTKAKYVMLRQKAINILFNSGLKNRTQVGGSI